MSKPLQELLDLWESPTGDAAEQGDEMARRLQKLDEDIPQALDMREGSTHPILIRVRRILDGKEE